MRDQLLQIPDRIKGESFRRIPGTQFKKMRVVHFDRRH